MSARIESQLAEALANAGRSAEAALTFQESAQHTGGAERQDLEWKAAYHFAISGRIGEGKATFARILDEVRLRIPRTPKEAILSVLWLRLRLFFRGFRFRARSESEIPKIALRRADLAWAAATGLTLLDMFGPVAFACRNLLLALDTGDPVPRCSRLAARGVRARFQPPGP